MKNFLKSVSYTAVMGVLVCGTSLHAKEYDYIIVGAGTAGSVLAYELSNDKKTKVLVLEEGPNRDQDSNILNISSPPGDLSSQAPASNVVLPATLRHTYYHEWFTIPMAGTNPGAGLQNRPILYGGARVAGGTSATNGILHLRPTYQALNNWVALTGDNHYSMGNTGTSATPGGMLERWVKINTYLPADPEPQLYWHGYGTNPNQINTIFDRQQQQNVGGTVFANGIAAFSNTRFGQNLTPNVDSFAGPSPFNGAPGAAYDRNNPNYPFHATSQVCLEQRSDRTRSHSSREFLLAVNGDAPEFPNAPVVIRDYEKQEDRGTDGRKLKVLYNSTVLNIEWDDTCKKVAKAKSVVFSRDGVCYKADLKKCGKIILSAGINSATILLKNGIGPAAELQAANIPVVFDSPNVGKNIQNHPIINIGISQSAIDGITRRVTKRARASNIATLELDNVAGLNVGDYLNVSGVGGAGYNLNQVEITAISGNNVSYFSLGADQAVVTNTSLNTGATPSSSVIKVDRFRMGDNSQVSWMAKVPYGWDGLGPIDLTKLAKWSFGSGTVPNAIFVAHMNPAARGFVKLVNEDPLTPVSVDLQYLASNSDVTDHIAMFRQIVNLVDSIRNGGNLNYNIGTTPSRATIRGTAAPSVTGYSRSAGVATLTLAGSSPALAVGTFITVGDNNAPTTTMPDASFNAIGAVITAVTSSPVTISYANPGPDVAFTAIAPLANVVLDQSALVSFIRGAFNQNHHYLGSCQMRDTFANGGVVDPHGNVFGTMNVMVCDASSFPTQIDSNLAGTVYPFALKIAEDLISKRNPLAKKDCHKSKHRHFFKKRERHHD